jgi:hypothetical protein
MKLYVFIGVLPLGLATGLKIATAFNGYGFCFSAVRLNLMVVTLKTIHIEFGKEKKVILIFY